MYQTMICVELSQQKDPLHTFLCRSKLPLSCTCPRSFLILFPLPFFIFSPILQSFFDILYKLIKVAYEHFDPNNSKNNCCSFENNSRLEGPELIGLASYDTNCNWTNWQHLKNKKWGGDLGRTLHHFIKYHFYYVISIYICPSWEKKKSWNQ